MVAANDRQVLWILIGLSAYIVTTWIVYRFLPYWTMRRGRLKPIPEEDAAEILEALRSLSRSTATLNEVPQFVWDPTNGSVRALAFGRRRAPVVSISGGLVTLHFTDPPRFRAIVLHELAHVRNQDIGKAYLAVAAWRAFVVVAVLPLAANLLMEGGIVSWKLGWRVLALSAFVLLTRNAYLRARELDADARVVAWDGPERIAAVLGGLHEVKRPGWRRLLLVHPTPAARSTALVQPAKLLEASSWEAAATGIAIALALPVAVGIVSLVVGSTLHSYFYSALALAPLAAGVVGLVLWRGIVASGPVLRDSARLAVRLGLGLGIGYVVGKWISLDTAIESSGVINMWTPAYLLLQIISAVVVTVGFVTILSALAAGVIAWVPAAMARRRPNTSVVTASLAVLALALAGWLGASLAGEVVAETVVRGEDLGVRLPSFMELISGLILVFTLSWWTLAIASSLWIFPISVWLWRRWPYRKPVRSMPGVSKQRSELDVGRDGISSPRSSDEHVFPGIATRLGLAAAIVFLAGLLLVRVLLHFLVEPSVRGSQEFRMAFYERSLFVAVAIGVVVALVSAWRVRVLPQPHGMMAASVAGAAMAFAILAASAISGCVPVFSLAADSSGCQWVESGVLLDTIARIVNGSLMWSLPIMAVGAAVFPQVRSTTEVSSESLAGTHRAPTWVEMGVIGLAAAATSLAVAAPPVPTALAWKEEANRVCLEASSDIRSALDAQDYRQVVQAFAAMLGDLQMLKPTGTDPIMVEAMIRSYERATQLLLKANLAAGDGDASTTERLAASAVAEFQRGSAIARELGVLGCQV